MSLGLRGRSLLLIAFFLSGAASLIFEVIWTRLLLISLGATAIAVGVVLGAFMGGMAVGSALAGRGFLTRRDPIVTYALLEGWVGLYGIATPFLLRLLAGTPPTLQFLMAVIVLLPSTIAMGASLPVLSRAFGRGSGQPAVQVGNLYAANTAGAVAGPLLAVFWLFPAVGLSRCLHIAAVVNLVVFAGLILGRKAFPPWESGAPQLRAPETDSRWGRPSILLLIAMGVSGATAMVYEVAWARTLSMVYGSSVYGVSIMLSTFLLGIAAGSALAAIVLRWRGRAATLSTAAWLLAGSAGGAFLSLIVARGLPFFFVNLYRSFPERDSSLFLTQFVVSVLLMLPVTSCLGAMLPVSTSASASDRSELGRQVSWLYTANLLGSTTGAIVAAGLLIGNLGIELSVRLTSALALAVALILVTQSRGRRFSAAGVAVLAGGILFVAGIDPSGEPVTKGFGFYTDPRAYDRYDLSGLREIVETHQLLYYRDGPTATVAVQWVDKYLFLKINGKTDASNGPGDLDTQILLGHIPLMVADAKQVAIIGWGSGMTGGAVLSHDVDEVDAFEIEPAVVEASRFFHPEGEDPLDDARLRMILGDARSRLYKDKKSYDLIISEPSNPWLTGVANLFTKEFFELAASRLEQGGILCQWFHLYGMSEESTRSLLATFKSVFPHTLVFKDRDLILLGSQEPIRFDIERMNRLFEEPRIQGSLSRSYINYPFDLLADLRLDERGVETYANGAPLNTDDNLLLELAAPRSLYRDNIDATRAGMDSHSRSVLEHLSNYGSPTEVYLELASSFFTTKRMDEALATCRLSLGAEATFEGWKLLGLIQQSRGETVEARKAWETALTLEADPKDLRFVQAALRSLDSPPSP